MTDPTPIYTETVKDHPELFSAPVKQEEKTEALEQGKKAK